MGQQPFCRACGADLVRPDRHSPHDRPCRWSSRTFCDAWCRSSYLRGEVSPLAVAPMILAMRPADRLQVLERVAA